MDVSLVKQLVKSAHAAPSGDNTQPWHFDWDGHSLIIRYDTNRVRGKTFPQKSAATHIAIGSLIENIHQFSMGANISYDLSLWPEHSEKLTAYAVISNIRANAHISENSKHPLFKRHTNRFPYKKDSVSESTIKLMTNSTEGDARIQVLNDKSLIKTAARLITNASEVRFQTQEVHEWLGRSFRFSAEDVRKSDGLDIKTLDLPLGGTLFLRFIRPWSRMQALNRIGAYKLLAAIDAAPIKAAPALVAFIAPQTPQGALDAGRLLTRTWIQLNAQGIAVQPYYVVADQLTRLVDKTVPSELIGQVKELKKQSQELFQLRENETLYMLFRIGYPTKDPVRSRRLPIDQVFTDLTTP